MRNEFVYEGGDRELVFAGRDAVNIEEQLLYLLHPFFVDLLAFTLLLFIVFALVLRLFLFGGLLCFPLCLQSWIGLTFELIEPELDLAELLLRD